MLSSTGRSWFQARPLAWRKLGVLISSSTVAMPVTSRIHTARLRSQPSAAAMSSASISQLVATAKSRALSSR
jgi:hypothetical protein